MSYALQETEDITRMQWGIAHAKAPVVIIGTGPVGVRAAQLLMKQDSSANIVIYGNEPWEPYNRVQLSTFLAGELDWIGLVKDQKLPEQDNVIQRINCAVTKIDREDKTVTDASGHIQSYSQLIIATGSTPHIPNIRGIGLPGIYRFRDLSDVQKLMARRIRSRRTIIIGGGVLGLEAARAMSRENTEVYVIDHTDRLMSSQLDETAAETLKEYVLSLNIRVYLNSGVKEILGKDAVSGVILRNGIQVNCDTIVLATGIRPNIELARQAGISVGRGIRVNDNMQTSDETIYAIGECAEHRNIVYGLIAPGYEQAKVAAYSLQGKQANYQGSITATRLKVVGIDVFSMGYVNDIEPHGLYSYRVYHDPAKGVYRKIVTKRGRLVGAIAIGEWDQVGRVQEAITTKRFIWPLQLKKFITTGDIWPSQTTQNIAQWPANTTVCNCNCVTRGELTQAIAEGHKTVDALIACTGASTVCGSCKPKLAELAGTTPTIEPDKQSSSLLIFSALALIAVIAIIGIPNIMYNPSVDVIWQWDKLWRDNLLKQITGYTAGGAMLLATLISLRKRWKFMRWLDYADWRLVHTILGVIAVTALVTHTGLRMGNNINYILSTSIALLFAAGIGAGIAISRQHKLDYAFAQRLRENLTWGHILLFWPVPVLLGFHILKTYYY